MWKRFKAVNGGILVVGHGTRLASGVQQLLELEAQIRVLLPGIPIQPSFLELAEPSISQAMTELARQAVKQVLVVPILLFEAAHALSDIPEAVETAASQEGIVVFGQSLPLGTHAAALDLSKFRFEQALRCRQSNGCMMAGACEQRYACFESLVAGNISPSLLFEPGSIGLAMVGRGTSDKAALQHMRRFTELRVSQSEASISWVETGFFAGGAPSVDELLGQAANSQCDTIVVQPHLLFEGELIRQLRQKVDRYRENSLKKRWLVAPTLGADPKLAEAFLSLASETLREKAATGEF